MKWREAIPALMGLLIIALFTANYLQNNQSLKMMDGRFAQIDERFAQIDKRFAQIDKRFAQIDERFAQIDERFARLDRKIDYLDAKIVRLDEKWQTRHEKTMSMITDMQIDISAMDTKIRHLQETVSRIEKELR